MCCVAASLLKMHEFLGPSEIIFRVSESPQLVEQARNLSHILHHYLVGQKKQMALLIVLKQINAAEKADSDFHEVPNIIPWYSVYKPCPCTNCTPF